MMNKINYEIKDTTHKIYSISLDDCRDSIKIFVFISSKIDE
jgi:hypothetical protein